MGAGEKAVGPSARLALGQAAEGHGEEQGRRLQADDFQCPHRELRAGRQALGRLRRLLCKAPLRRPASGWFEWTGPQGAKTKHRFARADGQAVWFAGIWDRCTTLDAGEFASFTILTGPSAGRLADYHDRAPVILEPEEWSRWLDPAQDAGELLAAVRPERFEVSEAAA